MPQSLRDAAVEYAEAGLWIFPCRRNDKRPAVKGYRHLRMSVAEVKAHWTCNPEDNIGIDGEANGLVFVDVDLYKEGVADSWGAHLQQFASLTEAGWKVRPDQRTPSGGLHYVYTAREGRSYVAEFLPGVDVKHRGYILLAPSRLPQGVYKAQGPTPWWQMTYIQLTPPELDRGRAAVGPSGSLSAALSRAMREERSVKADDGFIKALEAASNPTGVDREAWLSVGMAMRDLYHGTPHAKRAQEAWVDWSCDWEGAGDDDVDDLVKGAYKVWPEDESEAAQLVQQGRERGQAAGIPKMRAALVSNGCLSEAEWNRLTGFIKQQGEEKQEPPPDLSTPDESNWSWRSMPGPRRWLIKSKVWRGKVTVISGPGGVGKSSYVAGMAIDAAMGRPTVLKDDVHEQLTVLLWNGEDDREETARKVHALLKVHEIDPEELGDRLHIHDSRSMRLDALHYLTTVEEPSKEVQASIDKLQAQLDAIAPDLIIVDPLVSLHGADENSNSAMESVMDVLRGELAGECEAAVVVAHHTKKLPTDLDKLDPADMARGASAINAAARAHYMLRTLTEQEAARQQIPPASRRAYVTVLDAKNNLSRLKESDNTFHLHGVYLDNGDEDYPEGDNVGAIVAYKPPETRSDHEMAMAVVLAMAAERGEEARWWAKATQNAGWVGNYIRELLDPVLHGDEAQRTDTIKALVSYMVRHGLLIARHRKREKDGRDVPGYTLSADAETKASSLSQTTTGGGREELSD